MSLSLGSDTSDFCYFAFVISVAVVVVIALAWKDRLASKQGNTLSCGRNFFFVVGLWAISFSAIGQLAFSAYRVAYRSDLDGARVTLIAPLFGFFLSLLGLMGFWGSGRRRVFVVSSSAILVLVWVLTVLDDIRW